MVSKYYKVRNKCGGNNSVKPFQLFLRVYVLAFGLFLNSAIQIILEICLVGIIVPKKQKILPHVGTKILLARE